MHGFVAYYYSNPIIGRVTSLHGQLIYQGTCNNILNNTTSNGFANINCYVEAAGNYWGQAPPDPAKILYYNGSYIAYGYWGTPSQPCPGGGGGATRNPIGGSPELVASGSASIETNDPVLARLEGNFTAARDAYLDILNDDTLEQTKRERALVGLYEVLRDSKDPLNLRTLEDFAVDSELGPLAIELLMNSQVIIGDYAKARDMALAMSQSEDREQKNNALILLASLDSYSPEYSDVSNNAKGELKSSGIDEGILVALGIEPVSETTQENPSGTTDERLTVSNYPNPFNPSTTISFTIPSDGHVRIRIYDMLGRVVQQLVDENRQAGSHIVIFEGSRLPSAAYIYRLEFNGTSITKKFILAK